MPRLRASESSAYTAQSTPGPHTAQSTPGPSARATPAVSGSSSSAAAPNYENPSFSLTPAARDKIAMLLNQYPSQKLNTYLKTASDGLTTHVDEINLMYTESKDTYERQHGKRARGDENGADESQNLRQLQQKVDAMTDRMEQSVRKCIDAQAKVDAVNKALREVQGNAQKERNTQATQATAAVTQDGEASTENGSEKPEHLKSTFADSCEKHTDAYLGKQPKLRYKEHDWFRNFKQTAYYAKHGEHAKRINPDTWFNENGGPRPGETGAADNDEDFEEMGERISTKCPLTLQEFEEPVTSKKCPHSFEKSAILDFLKNVKPPTKARSRPGGWQPEIECPVPGCDSHLTKDDLDVDMRLKMLIKRKQRQAELARQQAEEEDEGRQREERAGIRAEEIESGSEDDIDHIEGGNVADSSAPAAIKREKMRRATQDAVQELDDD